MRLLGRASVSDHERIRDSHELPKFSFERDDRPLVSTERLFHQWSEDEETAYNPAVKTAESALNLEQDVIVGEVSPCIYTQR